VRLASTSGQTVDVASFRGKRNVLLYFYEHAG
jgi:peroxiredoxin